MTQHDGVDEATQARLRGEADAAAGRAMDAMYWYKPDPVRAAYVDGYKHPPKVNLRRWSDGA